MDGLKSELGLVVLLVASMYGDAASCEPKFIWMPACLRMLGAKA